MAGKIRGPWFRSGECRRRLLHGGRRSFQKTMARPDQAWGQARSHQVAPGDGAKERPPKGYAGSGPLRLGDVGWLA
jgi:hypothetical protein